MELPRPVPRSRGVSADNVPVAELADSTATLSKSFGQPIPVPRHRNTSSGSDPIHQDSITDEEDIYSDNNPPTKHIPPKKRVVWGGVVDIEDKSLETGPNSSGFSPIGLSWTSPALNPSADRVGAQLGALSLGSANDQGLTQREMAVSQKEASLRRWEESLRAKESDQEFIFSERERIVQMREDAVHMREKDVKNKEFDLMSTETDPQSLGDTGAKLADLAAKEMELDEKSRQLDLKERDLHSEFQSLQRWEQEIKQREAWVTQREAELARSPSYQPYSQQPISPSQPPSQHYTYKHHTSYHPVDTRAQYYGPSQTYGQQSQAREHTYTQPQSIQLPQQQPRYQQPKYTPQTPPITLPSMQFPPAQYPHRAGASLPPPIHTTQGARPVQSVVVDEELATMLQSEIPRGQTQIDEDAEIARKLQEQEERELKAKLEMDAQIAILMQHQEVDGDQLTNDFTGGEDSAQEAIQKRLQKELARKREIEEQDRRLAEELSKGGEIENIPARNDLNS